MDPVTSIVIALVALFALILVKVPIAFALLGSGALGLVLQEGPRTALSVVANEPFRSSASFALLVVPLFIALGVFAKNAGVAETLYAVLSRRLRKLPGGLGVATIVACAAFGAVSGSSTAVAATIGKTSVQEMLKHGYSPKMAGGIVASAGTLGIIIPPSIALVLFGIVTGESVNALLLAGIVPGIVSMLALIIAVVMRQSMGARTAVAVSSQSRAESSPVRSKVPVGGPPIDVLATPHVETTARSGSPSESSDVDDLPALRLGPTLSSLFVALLFIVIMGGIYLGFFTATESAAVGAGAALLIFIAVSVVQDRENTMKRLQQSLREASSVTAMIFAIFIGAGMFNYLLVSGRVPQEIAKAISDSDMAPVTVVALFLLILLPLGMILDGNAMLLIIAPLAYPVVTELGFSGVWFAIMFVKMIEIGLLTPPVGLNAYVVAGVSKGVTVGQVFRGVWPFVLVDLLVIALLFVFPELVTFLPDTANPAS